MLKNKIEEFDVKSNGFDNKYHGFYYTSDYILGYLVKGTTQQVVKNKIERIAKKLDIYAESQIKHEVRKNINVKYTADDLPF
jgi:hypothetical protein